MQGTCMLARLVLYTGDEVLRRLASFLLKETSGLSPLVDMLIKNFPEQDSVPFGKRIYGVHVSNMKDGWTDGLIDTL